MNALARWCWHHRRVVVVSWLLLVLVIVGLSRAAGGGAYEDSFSFENTDSAAATALLQQAFPAQAGDSDTIVFKVDQGTIDDPAVQSRVSGMLGSVAAIPDIAAVVGPYTQAGAGQINDDRTIAYARVLFDEQASDIPRSSIRQVVDTAEAARTDGLQVELGGQAIRSVGMTGQNISDIVGVVAAAVILYLAFGSALGTLLPIVVALAGIIAGIEFSASLSHLFAIPNLAPTLSALIGLGVGIDYALFILTRFRREVRDGASTEQAALTALNTSGRAVLFTGGTVCIALLGLLVLGVTFLDGVAIAAVITVLFAVLAAVTLLPALLGFFGTRVLSRRERAALARVASAGAAATDPAPATARPERWARWADLVQRRRRPLAAGAVLFIILLAVPVLSIRLGSSDAGNDPASSTTRKAYDLLSEGFGPGFNGPLQVVAQAQSGATAGATVSAIQGALSNVDGVASVTSVPTSGAMSVYEVFPTTSPESAQTQNLLERLRDDVLPGVELSTGSRIYVGGPTAIYTDFADVLAGKVPEFIAIIVILSAVLMMLAFRSLVIPLTAALMNLLAVAAAFGVIAVVFGWGWGSDALGMGPGGPIEPFVPVMMIAILFGLSTDYQVFLVSRMHEEWIRSRDNSRAVRVGQTETGRVVTAAAAVMICVFLAFILLGQRAIGEFGIGLAVAVALDASSCVRSWCPP